MVRGMTGMLQEVVESGELKELGEEVDDPCPFGFSTDRK